MDSVAVWQQPAVVKSLIAAAAEGVKSWCALKFRFVTRSLTKINKLTSKREFRSFRRNSTRLVGKYIIVDVRSNRSPHTRMGLTVVRQFGKSHERNRFKRQSREAFRQGLQSLAKGIDLNIRPRRLAHFAKTQDIYEELLRLLNSYAGQPKSPTG